MLLATSRSFLRGRHGRGTGAVMRYLSDACPPTGCGAATCSVNNSSSADRIHSTDIAFKPNKDGWGYSKRYSNNFEAIFGKKEVTNAATQGEKKIPQNH